MSPLSSALDRAQDPRRGSVAKREILIEGKRSGCLVTLARGLANDDDALRVRSDAGIAATLNAGDAADYPIPSDRHGCLVPTLGTVLVNCTHLETLDGAAFAEEAVLRVSDVEDAEIVLVEARGSTGQTHRLTIQSPLAPT